jgi:hypothetical protein
MTRDFFDPTADACPVQRGKVYITGRYVRPAPAGIFDAGLLNHLSLYRRQVTDDIILSTVECVTAAFSGLSKALADDYDVPTDEIEAAIRCELQTEAA